MIKAVSTLRLRWGLFAIFCAASLGCAGMGNRVPRADLPANAPEVEEILGDLGSNDNAIQTFRAAGSFTLESPKLTATQRFRNGSVKFRRPSDLFVQGHYRVTNQIVFKLTCVGDAYLMEFPTSKEDSFYQFEGDVYAEVPFSVSPSDIAKEMFLPESWSELPRREVTIIAYDEAAGSAMLEIGPRGEPRRRIDVARYNPENPAWVVVRNTRLDENGRVLAITDLRDYHDSEGIRFPARIEAYFPTEDTRMIFEMRNIRPNYQLTDKDFDIEGRIRELDLEPRHAS